MARDGADLPPIVEKCCQAIEKHGLDSQGIYRLAGTQSKVQELRRRLDKGVLLYAILMDVSPTFFFFHYPTLDF